MHFTHIRLIISRSPKERDEYINSQIQNVCTKSLLRIHSVQHYYRNASHRRHLLKDAKLMFNNLK